MIMMDQSKRLSEPLRWGRRERIAVGALLACVVLAVVGLGAVALTNSSPPRRKDCVEVVFASTLGGAVEHACGARARALCASPQAFKSSAAELRASCRRAGFPFG
ncbi:MAG TPA: hypothetical protein VMG80_07645 [Solirubrobacteraceae bacterium]|nr:hypothetical protein [Solirubrobacteraceae bacterium]